MYWKLAKLEDMDQLVVCGWDHDDYCAVTSFDRIPALNNYLCVSCSVATIRHKTDEENHVAANMTISYIFESKEYVYEDISIGYPLGLLMTKEIAYNDIRDELPSEYRKMKEMIIELDKVIRDLFPLFRILPQDGEPDDTWRFFMLQDYFFALQKLDPESDECKKMLEEFRSRFPKETEIFMSQKHPLLEMEED